MAIAKKKSRHATDGKLAWGIVHSLDAPLSIVD
jgi:hypothetical protein